VRSAPPVRCRTPGPVPAPPAPPSALSCPTRPRRKDPGATGFVEKSGGRRKILCRRPRGTWGEETRDLGTPPPPRIAILSHSVSRGGEKRMVDGRGDLGIWQSRLHANNRELPPLRQPGRVATGSRKLGRRGSCRTSSTYQVAGGSPPFLRG